MSEPTGPVKTGGNDEELFTELVEDFLRRYRAGQRPSVEEYATRYPGLADRIRELFPAALAMEQPGLGPTLDATPSVERVGAIIGRYKLLELIGEGGFGVVYMAEQQQPVRRKVALKVIKPGIDTWQVVARFEAERQALALMDHPSIARVLDGGTTDSGRPYFVMELVHGVPITEYCDKNELPPRERLQLFVQVCRAVQHAHTKGIIHRDIKPTNVLVTLHEGTPVPKVIDFGVAKATGQQLTEKTLFTHFAQMIGTPLYMSPEQAEMTSIDVDTRSDVYSLGVLLYELLTGTTPVDKERLKQAAFDEVRRIIREEEPPRPSTRLSTMGDQARTVSAQRRSDPRRLGQLFRGELDWIVMKALEKERARRYETANGLARDVERYLRDETVEACPPSAGYRLRKFARRHRVPLMVGAGFALLLVAGAAVSAHQAFRIRAEQQNTLIQKKEADRQRSAAEWERDRAITAEQKALTEGRRSEQIAAFLTDMLEAVGPNVALGRDTTMLREILDDTSRRLGQLKEQPAVEAHLRMVIGRVYMDLGNPQSAEAMFRIALDLLRELLGDNHADVAQAMVELGASLSAQAKWGEAESSLTAGLEKQRELLGGTSWQVGFTLFRMGLLKRAMSRFAEAEAHFREVLAIYPLHQMDPGGMTGALDQLAAVLTAQGKHDQAEPVALESLTRARKEAPPTGNLALAYALLNYGAVLQGQGKPAEAAGHYREALAIGRKQLPPDHPATVTFLFKLAQSLIACGRSDEALPFLDECVALGVGKPGLQIPFAELIASRFRHFQNSNDGKGCRASAEMWERLNGADADFFYSAARWRALTAALLRATDRSNEGSAAADEEVNRAVAWLGQAVDSGLDDIARIEQDPDLEAVLGHEGFLQLIASPAPTDEAIASAREAVRQQPGDAGRSAHLKRLLRGRAWALANGPSPASRDPRQAIALADELVALAPEQADSWHTLSVARYRAGDYESAIAAQEKCRELGDDDGRGGGAIILAMAHWQLGNKEEALRWHVRVAESMERQVKSHPMLRFRAEAEELMGPVSPQALAAERQHRLNSQESDLSRDVARNPTDAQPYRARAAHYYRSGHFRKALPDLEKVMEFAPGDHVAWFEAAGLYVWLGERERYRAVCRGMLDRFEKIAEQDPEIAERTAKACALAPDSVPDFDRAARLADSCIAGTEGHQARRWFVLVKALTEYRAGRDKQVVEWLGRFAPDRNGTHSDGTAFALLALADHRLGHSGQARAWLESARGILASKPPDAMHNWSWRDWLHCEILCREAEQVLAK